MPAESPRPPREISIWWFAFGYFAAYAPYSALTKVLSSGMLEGVPAIAGTAMLPVTVAASFVGMIAFLWISGWIKYAGRRRFGSLELPFPGPWTFLSGLCTAAIVVTTTLAYTFDGVSIVFVMLLMRGGVLVIAPIVDAVTGRKVRWFSWAGLALSAVALVTSVGGDDRYVITLACGLDIALYLFSYFARLRFMSRNAKSDVPNANIRYFVEEQLVATPAALGALVVLALFSGVPALEDIRWGFTGVWSHPALWLLLVVGFLSQGTGIFGGLILLDKRENTYCVPVNRASSVLAGVVASFALVLALGATAPGASELTGAGLIVGAIVMLSVPPLLEKRRRPAPAPAPSP